MIRLRHWDWPSRFGLVALLAAGVFTAMAAVGAWRVTPWPASDARGALLSHATPVEPDTSATVRAVMTSTERNPFRPDRRRPPTRYQLPSERTAQTQAARRPLGRPPVVRLLGIARAPGRPAVAALEVQGSPPRLMQVGDVVGGFEIVQVDGREVILVGTDTTLVLSLADSTNTARARRGGGRP